MESPPQTRTGSIASDLFIIFVTAAQLIFFAYFHRYFAWPTNGPGGSVTRLSLLNDDYFTWLSIVIAASILVIVVSIVMIFYDRIWFRQSAEILFCLIGITVTVSLLVIFPFDFSAIPDARAAKVVPIVATVVPVLMAVFYAIAALVMLSRFRSHTVEQGNG
ncbi:hypothetical protein ACFLWA_08070 [Chloroflexota bacterium]